jgi:hypothetical protein
MRRLFLFVLLATMFAACSGAHATHSTRTANGIVVAGAPTPGRHELKIGLPQPSRYLSAPSRQHGPSAHSAASSNLSSDLASAANGTVIHLASGTYPAIDDTSARSGWVTVSGEGDATPPQIAGAMLWGAQYVRFVDVKFTSLVYINHSPYINVNQRADNIAILNSEIECGSTTTSPLTTGIFVRGGSSNIMISGDYVHNCVNGFISQAQDPLSQNISLTYDTFSHFPGDAIDLGGLSDVTISHNIITDIADPAGQWHNDGIQFFGNVHNVDITDNVISNCRVQLIFIQDAVPGTISHVRSNTNILVAHNLIYGAGAVAVQDQGGIDVRFVGNTMWDNYYDSLWLRASPYTGIEPENTVIVDNVIEGFELLNSAVPTVESHNLIVDGPAGYSYGPGDEVGVNPRFASEPTGNFQLSSDSPARGDGTRIYPKSLSNPMDPDKDAAATDIDGKPIVAPASLGPFQRGELGAAYGAPANTQRIPPTYK